MADTYRVLVTGAGSTTGVTVLKGLLAAADPALVVLMGDMNPDCAGAHLGDGFVPLPAGRSPDFPERALEVCRQRRIDLVIPVIDYEFPAWASLRPRLREAGTEVVMSARDALARCQEKDRTGDYFHSLGVPTLPTWRANDVADPEGLPYPIYLKPRTGRGSLDNFTAADAAEFRLVARKAPDLIVQPLARGTEVTIDTLSDLEGRFLAASPRVRLEVKSGQAVRSRTFASAELEGYARRIVEGLPIVGPACIQCFLTDAGPVFFEINPRFGAGTALSIHAGMNGPLALVRMAQRRPLPELRARPGVLMMRYWQEVFA